MFVALVFGLPLLLGLGRWDMGSDEAIYSYAVERILETGDWLTPRSIPSDLPFFEKPPLKFWMVAAAMRAGIVPADDAGMRMFDALFGAAALVYVYLLGARLAGPVCGVAAALILFAFGPLVFEHGVRSNNMEASLVLAYCGGIFHFVRWAGSPEPARRRRESYLVAGYFVLGFMTKFVAALFLPMVLGAAILARTGAWAFMRARWRDWIGPLLLAVVLISPWFIYQTLQPAGGREFWHVLVGEHVYRRLAGVLIPEHLAPWYYYLVATWRELGFSGSRLVVMAGLAALVWAGWRRADWLARVVLIWFVLPYALISLGTSKLLHYAYPFIPPLALGGGLACALALRAIRDGVGARVSDALRHRLPRAAAWAERPRSQQLLLGLSVVLVSLAVWTALRGPLVIEMDHTRVFRNGSVVRPLVLGVLALSLTPWGRRLGIGASVAVLLLVLPVERYFEHVRRIVSVNHPLREARDCAVEVQHTSNDVSPGVLRASGDVLHHSYYFYMRHAGPWVIADPPASAAALSHALAGGHWMPSLITSTQYEALAWENPPPAVLVEDRVVLLLPGAFERCVARVVAAGGRPVTQLTSSAAGR